jgi:hypothetical protein
MIRFSSLWAVRAIHSSVHAERETYIGSQAVSNAAERNRRGRGLRTQKARGSRLSLDGRGGFRTCDLSRAI